MQKHADMPVYRSLGYSIVEFMVALTLGSIITVAVIQVFTSTRSSYEVEENLARLQEGGRFAMEFLVNDLRMAGNAGCRSNMILGTPTALSCPQGTICNLVAGSMTANRFNPDGIRGYRWVGPGTTSTDWEPDLPAGGGDFFSGPASNLPNKDTDVIIVHRASALRSYLVNNATPKNNNIQVAGTSGIASQIKAGDILMVADCKGGDVFQTDSTCTGACPNPMTIAIQGPVPGVNSQSTLSHKYGNDAELMKLESTAYYIAPGTNGVTSSLYRRRLALGAVQPAEEMVQGVDSMSILYGVDTEVPTQDFIPDRYVLASNSGAGKVITNWKKVVAVRLNLLLSTPNNVGSKKNESFTFIHDGPKVMGPFDDTRQRYRFTTTIQLRNSGS